MLSICTFRNKIVDIVIFQIRMASSFAARCVSEVGARDGSDCITEVFDECHFVAG